MASFGGDMAEDGWNDFGLKHFTPPIITVLSSGTGGERDRAGARTEKGLTFRTIGRTYGNRKGSASDATGGMRGAPRPAF